MYEALLFLPIIGLNFCSQIKPIWIWNFFYLVDLSSSMWWASFALAPTSGDRTGSGAGPPRFVVVFNFVLFSDKDFDLAHDVFGTGVGLVAAAPLAWSGTARTTPVAVAPACETTCVPARRHFTPIVDDTIVATFAGVAGVAEVAGVVGVVVEAPATTGEGGGTCEVATAAGGLDSRLIREKSEGGGAEEGEGAQIGDGGGGWEELKVSSHAK
jgi:hypothetical protein